MKTRQAIQFSCWLLNPPRLGHAQQTQYLKGFLGKLAAILIILVGFLTLMLPTNANAFTLLLQYVNSSPFYITDNSALDMNGNAGVIEIDIDGALGGAYDIQGTFTEAISADSIRLTWTNVSISNLQQGFIDVGAGIISDNLSFSGPGFRQDNSIYGNVTGPGWGYLSYLVQGSTYIYSSPTIILNNEYTADESWPDISGISASIALHQSATTSSIFVSKAEISIAGLSSPPTPSPVPLPGTLGLFTLGLGSFGAAWLRQRIRTE